MNIRDLEYLLALKQHQHFGKAALACFVSQPALSMQIKKLETYLGVQLLERTNKSVQLTEIGRSLAEKATCILNHVNEFKEIAQFAKDPYQGQLKLGMIPTLAPYLLPMIMPPLNQAFPKLRIFLIEAQTKAILSDLHQGHLDATVMALPTGEGLTTVPLFTEEFVFTTSIKHPYSKRKTISHSDLTEQTLLLLEEGHCLRDHALAVCDSAQATVTETFRATSLETLRHMVAQGLGTTLMPALAQKKQDGLRYIRFEEPRPTRLIGMQWRKTSPKNALLHEIASAIKKTMKGHHGVSLI